MKDKKRKKRSFEDSVEVASDEDVKKSASKSGFSVGEWLGGLVLVMAWQDVWNLRIA